jgi:hypothetical protein
MMLWDESLLRHSTSVQLMKSTKFTCPPARHLHSRAEAAGARARAGMAAMAVVLRVAMTCFWKVEMWREEHP